MTRTEKQNLRDCVKILISGGNPANDSELKDEWKKWEFFTQIAFFALDSRYGNWQFCPIAENPSEIGVKTYEVLETIRGLYREKLNQEMQSSFNKIKHR